MLSRLFIAALWSPAGKVLNSWLSFVMIKCVFVTFSRGNLGQVRYFMVSIPDLCHLSYFALFMSWFCDTVFSVYSKCEKINKKA